jgi:hypothetical protein
VVFLYDGFETQFLDFLSYEFVCYHG